MQILITLCLKMSLVPSAGPDLEMSNSGFPKLRSQEPTSHNHSEMRETLRTGLTRISASGVCATLPPKLQYWG